jgi:hypothetical protein
MVSKITTPPSQVDLVDKVNEIIDGKQDTLVSGTNIKTVGGNSLLGSGDIAFPTVDSALSTTSTNAVQNNVITTALNAKIEYAMVITDYTA